VSPTCVGDGSGKLGVRNSSHPRQKYRVTDAKTPGEWRGDERGRDGTRGPEAAEPVAMVGMQWAPTCFV